jgi:hypothetical protein
LHLLKTNPELFAKFGLREADLDTPQTDSPPHLDVNVSSRSRMELCRLRMIAQCPLFGFLAHGGRPHVAGLHRQDAPIDPVNLSKSRNRTIAPCMIASIDPSGATRYGTPA